MNAQILQGDSLQLMPTLAADSIDSIITDPPYGLSFMGKNWDKGIPGEAFWREALRVAKPGAHLLAFGGTRTYHRLACAIEDAGWEIRDCVMWVYGSGFPKSHDVSKAIDKAAGAQREVVGPKIMGDGHIQNRKNGTNEFGTFKMAQDGIDMQTAPATPAAQQWQGWGTALKPAWEPIIVARKPLIGTVAQNVLAHGTGGINVDGCRVGTRTENESGCSKTGSKASENRSMSGANYDRAAKEESGTGRWPANVIHDGSDEVVGLFPVTTSGSLRSGLYLDSPIRQFNAYGKQYPHDSAAWKGDTGSAARFFYCAKASKADRDEEGEGLAEDARRMFASGGRTMKDGAWGQTNSEPQPRRNHHPTVKPTALMRYLCRLVTPPGGTVLDPFMGSGSTGKAAMLEHFNFIGIELQPEYAQIAQARIEHAKQGATLQP